MAEPKISKVVKLISTSDNSTMLLSGLAKASLISTVKGVALVKLISLLVRVKPSKDKLSLVH